MIYHLIRELVRLSAHIFYRHIEVVGLENIPREGATIFFGNHPNSLLDPALITAFGERKLHFMAKDSLFSKPLLNILLANMGAVPIKRRQDQAQGELKNESAFEALYQLLRRGGAMGIFPEGISHNQAHLAELKTGAARIALEMKRQGVEIKLIPCGLTYLTRDRFRSSVLIQFGEPISIINNEEHNARSLTDLMERHLRALTINAESWAEITLLDTVRRLYQPSKITIEERVELARRFTTHYPTIKHHPEVVQLATHVQAYQDHLFLLGLRDRDMSVNLKASKLFFRSLRHLTLSLIWLPLALLGSPLHFPIAYILGHGSRVIAPRKDVIATTKFIAGFLLLNGLYLAIGLLVWYAGWGLWSALVPPLLALSGFACLKLAERGRALLKTLWVWSKCITARRTIIELRAERRALRDEIHQAVNRYIPADIERLFYTETTQTEHQQNAD